MESSNIVDCAAPPYLGMVIHCFIWLLPLMAILQMLMTLSVPPAPRSSAKCTLLLLIHHDEHDLCSYGLPYLVCQYPSLVVVTCRYLCTIHGYPCWYTHHACHQNSEPHWALMPLDFPIPPDPDPLLLHDTNTLFTPLFPSSFGLTASPLHLPMKREITEGEQNDDNENPDEGSISDLSTLCISNLTLSGPLHIPACSWGTHKQHSCPF